ncbi:MAG TPA: leucine-rich repeat-containing protein kinase family protein [Variovorax sp.]|nr:leucine-rich repeat-containing protein kinase family protein [Variovorax sp.]
MTAATLERLRAGELAGATRLDLCCGLTELPPEVFELADTLEVLNLSGNALEDLPADLGRLQRLRILFCSDNRFARVPESVGDCAALEMVGFKSNRVAEVAGAALPPQLRWLILTDNELAKLPPELGRRPRLQKLMLAGNHLRELPSEMAACERLELLRIASNRFEALPDWLLGLPRLAWLAFAGNPVVEASEARAVHDYPVPDIPWSQLSLHEVLGEGASGLIYRATWQGAGVAVKLFKGQITSDGSPHSEMDACIAAGPHPDLIAVRGRITGHPAGTPGLVLQLIDAAYRSLAGPPSLESCTRDVYSEGLRFATMSALAIAGGMASAVAQLHAHGILHGDFYAHNILWDGQHDALLGDFGAASFFAPENAQAQALQRIEARAFGCLLEELGQRCEATGPAWRNLQERCLAPDVSQRPAFAEIADTLHRLA